MSNFKLNKASILVFLQFSLLGIILILNGFICRNTYLFVLQILAGLLGIWAILTMKLSNLSVSPEVKQNARLVISGPYKFIRHPMYTSILIYTIPLTLENLNLLSGSIQLVLIAVLIYKLRYEESLLIKHFADYQDYMKTTKRIIPKIY